MKYIESLELREWVKDSLKKTIFQKAHALAVQTGCEVLVKLHDTTDIAGCQYYATQNLRRLYRNSKLRQEGESLVSGETGSPLTDKCIQYEDEPTEGSDDVTPDDDGGGTVNEEYGNGEAGAVPMQITAATSMASETQTSQSVDITQVTNQTFTAPMQVKQEPELTEQYTQNPIVQTMPQVAQGQGLGAFSYPISPKPYQCSICRKAFKSVHVLQKHTLTFHMPSGTGSVRSRGKGRGTRGSSSRARGRGRGTMFSRPTLVQQPFQSPPMPTVKPEDDQNRFTCIMCNQNFEQSSQLNEHMSQCPMAPGASQGAQSDPATSDQFASPSAGSSEDQPGFSGDFSQEVPPTTSAPNWSFPPPDGAPPSGVPVSGTSQYYGQQSPSFGSPTQSPRSSGSGTSRNKMVRTASGILSQKTIMSRRSIMAAILQTAGPVSICQAIRWNWKFLSSATVQQFQAAGAELESLGFGNLVSLEGASHRGLLVFVKARPEHVVQQVELNDDLCSLEVYSARYHKTATKCITWKVRSQLIERGLVDQKQFM